MSLSDVAFPAGRQPHPDYTGPLRVASAQNGFHIKFSPYGFQEATMDVKMPKGLGQRMTLLMLIGTDPGNTYPITLTLRTQLPTSPTFNVEVSPQGQVNVSYTTQRGSVPSDSHSKDVDGASTYFYLIVFDVDDRNELMVSGNGTNVLEHRIQYSLDRMDVMRIQGAFTGWRLYELHVIAYRAPVFPGPFMHWMYPRLSLGAFIELRGGVLVSGENDTLELFHNGRPFGHIETDSTWHGKTVVITIRFGKSNITVSSSLGPPTFIDNVPLREPDLGAPLSIFSLSGKFLPHNAIIMPGFWGADRLLPS